MQRAATVALDEGDDFLRFQVERAHAGRDIVCGGLAATGRVRFAEPDGAFYLFFAIDGESDTRRLGLRLVDEANVGVAPGSAFGEAGAGFMRLCFARDAGQIARGDRAAGGLDRAGNERRAADAGAGRAPGDRPAPGRSRTLLTLAIGAAGGSLFGLARPARRLADRRHGRRRHRGGRRGRSGGAGGLRNVAFVVIGSFLGSSVSPELVGELPRWPISLAVLAVNLLVLQWAAQTFLHRVCKWDRQTAFFAAIPGLMSYVIALALPTRADTSPHRRSRRPSACSC